MRIYMDVCCLNRPFDNQTKAKILIESDAVLAILSKCSTGEWILLSSDILDAEINKAPDGWKKRKVLELYSIATEKIELNDSIIKNALFLEDKGLKPYDSLHVATAEYYRADVFLSTDRYLLKKAEHIKIGITTANPLNWFMEVEDNE